MFAAGCGSGPTEVSVGMADFSFDPNRLSLPQREKSVLLIENHGAVEHSFFIPSLNLKSDNLAPGAKQRLEIVPVRGPLKFICNIHGESVMAGEIAVTERKR
jgi:hypothetical protein